jgi:hypothetical protein
MEVPWEDGSHGGGVHTAPAALEHRRPAGSVTGEHLHEEQPHYVAAESGGPIQVGRGSRAEQASSDDADSSAFAVVAFSSRIGMDQ